MSVEIINIGTELVLGHVVNTNAAFLSRRLSMIGLDVSFHVTVGDNEVRLITLLNQTIVRAGIIMLTGGLGPTQDDITKKALAEVLHKQLILDKECLQRIKAHFRERKLIPPKSIMDQALVFEKAKVLLNRLGTAPGQILEENGKIVIMLPGVPAEMKAMVDEEVIPYLSEKFSGGAIIKSKFLKVFGLTESAAEDLIKDILIQGMNPDIGTVATDKGITIRLTAKGRSDEEADSLIKFQEIKIRERLGAHIFGQEQETMELVVGALLILKRKTISIAESSTGGKIADMLTDIPGSSGYFDRGVVCYSNKAKTELLKIPQTLIDSYGAVSCEVCAEMARNVREISGADLGLSITGIAGPGGATAEKPIGLAFIGLDWAGENAAVKEFRFKGSRKAIKNKMAYTALDILRRHLMQI